MIKIIEQPSPFRGILTICMIILEIIMNYYKLLQIVSIIEFFCKLLSIIVIFCKLLSIIVFFFL